MPRKLFPLIVLAALMAAAAVHARQRVPSDNWTLAIERFASPAGANTAEPQLSTTEGRAILSWLEIGGAHAALKFAERTASGWSEPRTVAEGDDFMVNAADVPSVRPLPNGTLVAQWLQQDGPDPESYKLRLSRSTDSGRTWTTAISPHRDAVQVQHGFASLFPVASAGFGVVWLDGRDINPEKPEDGNMALRAAVFDAAGQQQPEVVVQSRVCECCPTAAAVTSDGVAIAYRGRSSSDPSIRSGSPRAESRGEVRDIFVTRLVNARWTPPSPVHRDGWRIEGCPVNGPAISARGRDVAVAWFTAKEDQGHAFVAFSRDAGRTFGAPTRVDAESSQGRVGVELVDGTSAIVTWVELTGQRSSFNARRVDDRGTLGPIASVAEVGGTRYPRVARFQDEVLFAWTATVDNVPRVLTARVRP